MIQEPFLFVSVSARFYFWDGKVGYTIEFCYGSPMWFVFEGHKDRDALYSKKITAKRIKTPDRMQASDILNEYLKTLQT